MMFVRFGHKRVVGRRFGPHKEVGPHNVPPGVVLTLYTNINKHTHTEPLMLLGLFSSCQSSLKSSKKKKRTSLKCNKSSKKGSEVRRDDVLLFY